MTRSAARLGRFGGALLALATTLLLIPAFSGVALADTFTADQLFDARDSKPGDGRCDVSAETGGRQCTLRAAIQESNALDGRDTVVLIGGTYLLTLQNIDGNGDGFPDPEQRAATGDLDVRDETTVRGAGLDETIVQNTVNDRHFYLQRRITNAAISGLTLINGNSVDGTNSGRGGGIFSLGTLLLEDVALRQNQAFFGGAIDNRGTLIMRSSTVSNNVGTLGGGLYNEGQLAINDSTIANNTANRGVGDNGGLGGGLYNTTAPVKLTNSTIASNTAEVRGGRYRQHLRRHPAPERHRQPEHLPRRREHRQQRRPYLSGEHHCRKRYGGRQLLRGAYDLPRQQPRRRHLVQPGRTRRP